MPLISLINKINIKKKISKDYKALMKILTIQNRKGIGDMVIFLPFIEGISKKFNSPVSILVKENSKALEYLENNKHIEKILILERNNKNNYIKFFYFKNIVHIFK